MTVLAVTPMGSDVNTARDTSDQIISQLQSSWVWVADWLDQGSDQAGQQVLFRYTLDNSGAAGQHIIHLTADTRYKLVVNDRRVCVGPSRGSDRIWYYDTVDLAPYLRHGQNTIDIHVVRYFPNLPVAHSFGRTRSPGLAVVGHVGGHDIGTVEPARWKASRQRHIAYPYPARLDRFLHTFEAVEAQLGPRTWQTPIPLVFQNANGVSTPWLLAPRMIPLAEETPLSALRVRHTSSPLPVGDWEAFSGQKQPLTLPPNSRHRIEIEYPVHSTAFVRFMAKRPSSSGSTIKLTYSESYEALPRARPEDPWCAPVKTNRTGRGEGQGLEGPCDTYRFSGPAASSSVLEIYAPFWWKTFRFVVLEIDVDESGLVFLELETIQTNYPLPVGLSAAVPSDTTVSRLLDISVRTLRNCIFDGYSDCPFYEQLQYIEDSRSSALFHYYTSGDDCLARQAITAFAASQQPCGVLMGRYPSHTPQVITAFSLFWVLMVCDQMDHHGDVKWVKQFCPIIDGVLEFFENHIGPYGLVEGLPSHHWRFIDWSVRWDATPAENNQGAPVAGRAASRWTYVSMMYSMVLRRVAVLLVQVARPGLSEEYSLRSLRLNNAVRRHCFDGKFFTDSLASEAASGHYSQHCQVMGILCGAVDSEPLAVQQEMLAPTLSRTKTLSGRGEPIDFTPCSYILQHYVFRALSKVQLYDQFFHAMWKPWHIMMSWNVTTWVENDVDGRSDCHAWSALPLYEFPAEVAGLTPLQPGWGVVGFAPRIDLYPELHMTVPLGGRGIATVDWERTTEGVKVQLVLPESMPVVVSVNGVDVQAQRSAKTIVFTR